MAAGRAAPLRGPPLDGRAATTRPITIAGSRSSRSATRRTRSSRLAVSPIPARIGADLGERPVALGRRGDVGAVQHQADLEGGQLDRALDQRPEALGAALGSAIISAGSSPAGIAATRSRILPPGRHPLRPQHRLLAGRVGVERQHHLVDHPRERRHLLAR